MVIFLNKIIWGILNKPYFLVRVTSHNRKIKSFVQLAASKEQGADSFLICKALKSSWWKPNNPIIDGVVLEATVDLNNAIPLEICEDAIYESKGFLNIESREITISEDTKKQKIIKKTGNPQGYAEVSIIPTLLHEIVEAHLVEEIMSIPKDDRMEQLKWIFIAGFLVAGILIGIYILKG